MKIMQLKWSLWILSISIILMTSIMAGASDQLNELQRLKADNFKLKSQLLQCQVSVGNNELGRQQGELVEEFRKELGAGNEEVFDWNTLTFSNSNKSSQSK